jgi:hypothetical protein
VSLDCLRLVCPMLPVSLDCLRLVCSMLPVSLERPQQKLGVNPGARYNLHLIHLWT